VTEVRRRDRALLSKDATIREIHHRVKNNLQTVAALLRMQARRSADPSVRQALGESVRRVASIAMVHETLSTSPDDRVDLDQIVDRLVPMISDVAAAETSARVRRVGSLWPRHWSWCSPRSCRMLYSMRSTVRPTTRLRTAAPR
jgi:two-component sensor histidine kinase